MTATSIEDAVRYYAEQCHCGHSRGAHTYDGNEDSIICDECECAGFDTEPPEPDPDCALYLEEDR